MKPKLNMAIVVLTLLLISVGTCLGLGVFTHYFNRDLYRATREVSANWIPSISVLSNMRSDLSKLRRMEAQVLYKSEACPSAVCAAALSKYRQELLAGEAAYAPMVGPPEERVLFDAYKHQKAIYLNMQDQLLENKTYDAATFKRFVTESSATFEDTSDLLDRLIEFNSEEGEKSQAAVQQYYKNSQNYLFISNVILSITAALLILRLLILFIR